MSAETTYVVKDLTSGTVGGCAGIFVGHPLDTVKVRVQSQDILNPRWKSAFDCFYKTVRHEGVLALFKGMQSPLVGNAPMQAIVFAAYGQGVRFFDRNFPPEERMKRLNHNSKVKPPPDLAKLYAAGTWAGIVQTLVASPVELVKCKLQYQIGASGSGLLYKGPMDCFAQMIRANGLLPGIFRGFMPTLWRDGPTYGAYFVTFEWVKYKIGNKELGSESSLLESLFAGGCAGIVTWVFTYPFDVIKSVVQTLPDGTPARKASMMYVAKEQYKAHGWQFFVRGLGPTLMRAFPVNAVTLTVYDLTLNSLDKHF
mmetsp:Transcript_15879/g.31115  ORF Transcript_15879/g.31115 Transcript_15879/m.31115 type:complete len:312 (-) Transcript_15879:111-1046(-)|eukprot:CAMPEP_0175139384 /NCGR_PEP_ID=MMETSP0087-20121206/10870_1 /TAXON_ID=136419 /ORGANISM="Unknown Unknown, Strain D1" /LENGTH=311 /DNA_ID=CAMNT_0016422383 /DNA_START=95 /DNA_END=1030 /DNA_ORIENTATION=+